MNQTTKPETVKVLLAFAAIYIVWGSTYYGVSIALKSFPPFLLAALRLLFAGSVLLIVWIVRRESLPSIKDLVKHAACGVTMFIGGMVAVVWAQQYVSSSLASVIITTPFWFVLLDRKQWKFYFSSKWILTGLITGLIGVVLLLGTRERVSHHGDMQTISIVVMIVGSGMWALGSLFLKYHATDTSTFVSSSIQLLAAGFVCLGVSALSNEFTTFKWNELGLDSVIALSYLSIVSSLITFMAFVWLIKIRPPAVVSTYAYVNPIVGVLIGWGLGNEHVTSIQLAALAITLCGVFFVNIPKYQPRTT